MPKRKQNQVRQGRRDALKTLLMGAGSLTTLPILGQAEVSPTAPAPVRMAEAPNLAEQSGDDWKPRFFDEHQNETLIALTDVIIPETDTPGAKAALVNRYIDLRYSDRQTEIQRKVAKAGEDMEAMVGAYNDIATGIVGVGLPSSVVAPPLAAVGKHYLHWMLQRQEGHDRPSEIIRALAWFDGRSISLYGKPFVSLTKKQQTSLLEPLADPSNTKPEDQAGKDAFELIKGLTIFAYYTSKIGLEEELRYQGDTFNTSFPGACTHPGHSS